MRIIGDTAPTQSSTSETLPLAGESLRRLTALAAQRGLVCAPQIYTPAVSSSQAGATGMVTLTLNAQGDQGPLVVVGVVPMSDVGKEPHELQIQSGGRRLLEGRVRGADLFTVPLSAAQPQLTTPILVRRGDTLSLNLTAPGRVFLIGEKYRLQVVSFYDYDSGNLRPCGRGADDLVDELMSEGEFYASGVIAAEEGYVPVSGGNVVVETLVVTASLPPEGFDWPVMTQVFLGDHLVTPQDAAPIPFTSTGLRFPLASSTRVRIRNTYNPAIPGLQPVRVVAIGRRGGSPSRGDVC